MARNDSVKVPTRNYLYITSHRTVGRITSARVEVGKVENMRSTSYLSPSSTRIDDADMYAD